MGDKRVEGGERGGAVLAGHGECHVHFRYVATHFAFHTTANRFGMIVTTGTLFQKFDDGQRGAR
jgi:hypothetical protein